MPTTTPPRTPRPADPKPQPTSAPAPAHVPVVAARIAPASTGWKDDPGEACIRRENSRFDPRLCNSEIRCEKRPPLPLVHGSVVNGEATWTAQRPLAERFDLVVPNRRGFPPGPDAERVDFEDEAVWIARFLEPGAHLVGHSYGGVIALLAAARRRELVRSLTVIEPPAFALVRGHPAVEAFIERFPAAEGDPETFLRAFL